MASPGWKLNGLENDRSYTSISVAVRSHLQMDLLIWDTVAAM